MKIITAVLIIILFSCAPALYQPNTGHAEISGIPLENLRKGRQLYVDHCGSCHQLYLPHEYPPATWKINIDSMTSKARITDEDKKLIFDYLVTGRK